MEQKDFRLAVILSIDIPGLVAHAEDGDEPSRLESARSVVRQAASESRASLVKTMGDSILLSFANSADALACARRIQDGLSSRFDPESRARMGMHLGEVYFFGSDVVGPAVDMALALQAMARPGSLCVSKDIFSLIQDKNGFAPLRLPQWRRNSLPADFEVFALEWQQAAAQPQGAANAQAGSAGSEPAGAAGRSDQATAANPPSDAPRLEDVRRAILDEIRRRGRRLTVDEALDAFGHYGVEATEVIASMAEAGLLTGSSSRKAQVPPAGPSPSYTSSGAPSSDIGRSIESVVHAIVTEIEQAVQSSVGNSRPGGAHGSGGRNISLNLDKESFRNSARELKHLGSEIREQVRKGGRVRERRSGAKRGVPADLSGFRRYRMQLSDKADKLAKSLPGSIISFLVINAGLWYVNRAYVPQLQWAPIVSVFWGSGVIDSILGSIRAARHAKEAKALPDLDEEDTHELMAINKERDSIGQHCVSAFSVPAALFLINTITTPGAPWFIIPSAIIFLTFVAHLLTYVFGFRGRIRRFFEKVGLKGGRKGLEEAAKARGEEAGVDLGDYDSIFEDAKDSARDIESALSATDPESLKEMKPQLDGYLKQVLLLAQTSNELDSIIREIPMESLAKDKAALRDKLDSAPPSMRLEYEKNISEIEKQEESFKGLKEQREVIDLRLRSSVSQLHQLKMDMARARAADTESSIGSGDSAISSIKARAAELSHYIDDLKEGRLELLKDPFQELEEQARKQGETGLP